jgi:hypothetical protein
MGGRWEGRTPPPARPDGGSSLADDARSEGFDAAIWHGGPGPGSIAILDVLIEYVSRSASSLVPLFRSEQQLRRLTVL